MSERLYLVADSTPGTHSRRHESCKRLASCETAWSMAHGSAQAACPAGCLRFDRAARRDVEQLGGGRVTMGEGR